MAEQVLALEDGTRLMLLAPVIRDRKGEHAGVFEEIRRGGFVRVRVDGQVRDADEQMDLNKNKKHTIEVVVDRLVIHHDAGTESDDHPDRLRVIESLETALRIALWHRRGPDRGRLGTDVLGAVLLSGARRRWAERDRTAELLVQLATWCLPDL